MAEFKFLVEEQLRNIRAPFAFNPGDRIFDVLNHIRAPQHHGFFMMRFVWPYNDVFTSNYYEHRYHGTLSGFQAHYEWHRLNLDSESEHLPLVPCFIQVENSNGRIYDANDINFTHGVDFVTIIYKVYLR